VLLEWTQPDSQSKVNSLPDLQAVPHQTSITWNRHTPTPHPAVQPVCNPPACPSRLPLGKACTNFAGPAFGCVGRNQKVVVPACVCAAILQSHPERKYKDEIKYQGIMPMLPRPTCSVMRSCTRAAKAAFSCSVRVRVLVSR